MGRPEGHVGEEDGGSSDTSSGDGPAAPTAEGDDPLFFDPNADDRDAAWAAAALQGRGSDAVLSCPACFQTVCRECVQHDKYKHQFRAELGDVLNCTARTERVVQKGGDSYHPVECDACGTEVGLLEAGPGGAVHLFHVLATHA